MKRFRRSIVTSALVASFALAPTLAAAADAGSKDTAAKADHSQATREKNAQEQWAQAHRASKIIGAEVRNSEGEKIGAIKDLVVGDPESGRISHAVIAVGGVLGMGDKLFAVPYRSLRKSEGKDYFVLSSRSDLAQAFDDKHWPDMADATWKGDDSDAGTGNDAAGRSARASAQPETASNAAPVDEKASKDVTKSAASSSATPPSSASDKVNDSNGPAVSATPDASSTVAGSAAKKSEQNATSDNSGTVRP